MCTYTMVWGRPSQLDSQFGPTWLDLNAIIKLLYSLDQTPLSIWLLGNGLQFLLTNQIYYYSANLLKLVLAKRTVPENIIILALMYVHDW